MISKDHRFRGLNSLRFVFQRGKTVRGPKFAIKYTLNSRRGSYRAAVVVSRKVHKSAVARNRIRRKIYEAIRALEASISEPYDMVVTVFDPSMLDESSESLNRQLSKQFSDAGITTKQVR